MKTYRRDSLRLMGLAGAGIRGNWTNVGAKLKEEGITAYGPDQIRKNEEKKYVQLFNLSGCCASEIETVRIGFIGTGNRGGAAVERMSYLECSRS